MFNKTKRKIVAAIMSVLVLLWAGTLGVIYGSSSYEMKKQNRQMLQTHGEMYELNQPPKEGLPDKPEKDREDKPEKDHDDKPEKNHDDKPKFGPGSPMFQLSSFYTVAVSFSGDVLEIRNEQQAVHTDEELEQLAQQILDGRKESGQKGSLLFLKVNKDKYQLVVFMDNTVVHENAITLFRYTLIYGSVALVLFFFVSLFLAKKIVDPLEESYRKQKQFISDAGHELKTPVSVVSANAELLSRELGQNQWLQNIQYENQRMGILIGQLLDLARTENVTVQAEQMDLSRLISGEVLPFESVAFEKGLTLESDIPSGITVTGNSTQLRQLVSILLDNAIRHNKPEGHIQVRLSKRHCLAELTVINSGDEIPEQQRQRIFERFYRMDNTRNSETNHYGLGLAIAKAIVTAHHGHIEVRCYDGLVEFRVTLPLS